MKYLVRFSRRQTVRIYSELVSLEADSLEEAYRKANELLDLGQVDIFASEPVLDEVEDAEPWSDPDIRADDEARFSD